MKKRTWIGVAVLVLVAAVAVTVLTVPQNYFKSEDNLEIFRVEYVDAQQNLVDITDEIDAELLETYLPLMQCSRVRTRFGPYFLADCRYEITIADHDNRNFIHILLGDSELNYIYRASQGGYKIRNSEVWLTMLENGRNAE